MTPLEDRAREFATIQRCVVLGAQAMFAAYDIEVEHSPSEALDLSGPSVMAVIGYAAKGLRGALVLIGSSTFVETLGLPATRPPGVAAETVLRDVLGELSNMLVGRVKNQLLRYDVAPFLATPTTVFGEDLQLPAPRSGMSAWHRFTGRGGDLHVRLDATFAPDFSLGPETDSPEPALGEGEMVLF